MQAGMLLPGSPRLPFYVRFNLFSNKFLWMTDWLLLAESFIALLMMPLKSPTHWFYITLGVVLFCLDIMWRRQCAAQPNGGSYARWRELPAAVFHLGTYGLGAATHITASWLSQLGSKGSTFHAWPAARHAALLLFVSGVPTGLIVWTSTLRVMWAVPAHLAGLLPFSRLNQLLCNTTTLEQPEARWVQHQTWALLQTFRLNPLLPVPILVPGPASREPAAECAEVMTFLQLMLGVALPALAQAALEARLFEQHQRQRQQLGLPPERGLHASIYCGIKSLLQEIEGPGRAAALWALSSLLLDASAYLQARSSLSVHMQPPT